MEVKKNHNDKAVFGTSNSTMMLRARYHLHYYFCFKVSTSGSFLLTMIGHIGTR